MKKYMKRIAMLLCFSAMCLSMVLPAAAAEAEEATNVEDVAETVAADDGVQPIASDYINDYGAWLTTGSGGKIYIEFDITATRKMSLIGAKLIALEVKDAGVWTNLKNYSGSLANGMYAQNKISYGGTTTYYGTVGNQYRAVVTFYAGDSTGGDNRIMITNVVQAKS